MNGSNIALDTNETIAVNKAGEGTPSNTACLPRRLRRRQVMGVL